MVTYKKRRMALKAKARRLQRRQNRTALMESWKPVRRNPKGEPKKNFTLDCGWGRLLFANTFTDSQALCNALLQELPDKRDIAFYIREPHVLLSLAPQDLFLDPSHTFRLPMSTYRPSKIRPRGFLVRRLRSDLDAKALGRLYASRKMIPPPRSFLNTNRNSKVLTYFIATDVRTGAVIGSVMGVDHVRAFDDPENGSSLWCLAVDPQTSCPGVGEFLVRHLVEHYQARGRSHLDLSVMHDNTQAIALYDKLGFHQYSMFCVKHKNAINESLFTAHGPEWELNPYAEIIVKEALRRGIGVDVIDSEAGYFALTHGGRSIVCRESLSELTTAVAMSRCDDKRVTRRLLKNAELRVAAQRSVGLKKDNDAFLKRFKRIVVKPVRGEQGAGVVVDIRTPKDLDQAIEYASSKYHELLLEEYIEGEDLRVIVIDYQYVAAAVRKPPEIVGTGRNTVEQLIQKASRRRQAATGGESTIPIDEETKRCVRQSGYRMKSILPAGENLLVRRTANLHTGGTLHDATSLLHPEIIEACEKASKVIGIPVVGFDLIVPAINQPDYVFIEANERPGLANHEPQPTAQRFIDMLFPHTKLRRVE